MFWIGSSNRSINFWYYKLFVLDETIIKILPITSKSVHLPKLYPIINCYDGYIFYGQNEQGNL